MVDSNIKDKVNHYEQWTFAWVRAVQEWLQEVFMDTLLCGDVWRVMEIAGKNEAEGS